MSGSETFESTDLRPDPAPESAVEPSPGPRGDMVTLMPALRAFAVTLTKNTSEADDLVQETLLKALTSIAQFTPGTNLKAWLFAIARNTFYTNYRKSRRAPVCELTEASGLALAPEQEWHLRVRAAHEALQLLPNDQQEALMLVGGAGLSYMEAAAVCGCAIGTIKSRVSRGRTRLLTLLESETRLSFLNDGADDADHSE